MLPGFADLLLAYGIAFGSMNKVDFFHGKSKFTDALLKCAYCTGFHSGWMAWALTRPVHGFTTSWAAPVEALCWAFSASVFSYGCDTVLQLAESWVRQSED